MSSFPKTSEIIHGCHHHQPHIHKNYHDHPHRHPYHYCHGIIIKTILGSANGCIRDKMAFHMVHKVFQNIIVVILFPYGSQGVVVIF